jgi:hypothetical protein
MSIRSILADDKSLVTYRPKLRKIIPCVNGVILFQQILYWGERAGGKFYKFSSPCSHDLYKPGDSWEEETGLSPKELRTALDSFAFKCGKKNREEFGDKYDQKKRESLVLYYTDSNRMTWYIVNNDLVEEVLRGLYLINSHGAVTKENSGSAVTLKDQETTREYIQEAAPEGAGSGFASSGAGMLGTAHSTAMPSCWCVLSSSTQ